MNLREFVCTYPCLVEDCDFGAKPYPVGRLCVPLCNGHMAECDRLGREAFEAKYHLAMSLTAPWYESLCRSTHPRVLKITRQADELQRQVADGEIQAVRDAQEDVGGKYLA